jgi:cytosine/adenosine deaminase-related metal-dependent hydrolase
VRGVSLKVVEGAILLVGEELHPMEGGYLAFEGDRICEVGKGSFKGQCEGRLDARGLIGIPGLINAHIHVGDSAFKEQGSGLSLEALVRPPQGLKHRLLRETSREQILRHMRGTLEDMLSAGVTAFADFREGGMPGVQLLREALRGLKIRPIILGRPQHHWGEEDLEANRAKLPEEAVEEAAAILESAEGLGLSSPNEFTDPSLLQISTLLQGRGKLLATHAAEDPEAEGKSKARTGLGEVERAVKLLKASFLIHLTHARSGDFALLSERRVGAVVCPRANAVLGLGFPPVRRLMDSGVTVALGTDNVMVNSPDMFREMDFLSKTVKALEKSPAAVKPEEILQMATVNAAKVLGLGESLGSLQPGKLADVVFIDAQAANLAPARSPAASVVHRARGDNVKLVLVGGEVAVNKLGRKPW